MTPNRPGESPNPLTLYLRDIVRIPLLTAEQEVELAKQIEIGVLAQERLATVRRESGEHGDDLELIADLELLARQGAEAKRRLVEANLRLVVSLARTYASCGTPMLDLIQEGNLGLMHAVEKFDHAKGFRFSTYASWWIRQAIARGYGEQSRVIRVPVHVAEGLQRLRRLQRVLTQELGRSPSVAELARASEQTVHKVLELLKIADEPVSLDVGVGDGDDGVLSDLIADEAAAAPIDEISQHHLRREVQQLLRRLPPREQQIVRMRFGIAGNSHTLEEVGNVLGVTRERVRQIEARALYRLRTGRDADAMLAYLQA